MDQVGIFESQIIKIKSTDLFLAFRSGIEEPKIYMINKYLISFL